MGQGDLRAQTVQVFENLKAALAATEAGFEHVIKLNLYMVDISQIAVVREIRNQYLTSQPLPVSMSVQVSRLVHSDWLVEIEVVAYLPE